VLLLLLLLLHLLLPLLLLLLPLSRIQRVRTVDDFSFYDFAKERTPLVEPSRGALLPRLHWTGACTSI
jgi:hypothetical protein